MLQGCECKKLTADEEEASCGPSSSSDNKIGLRAQHINKIYGFNCVHNWESFSSLQKKENLRFDHLRLVSQF